MAVLGLGLVAVQDTPIHNVGTSRKPKYVYSAPLMADLLRPYSVAEDFHVVIEKAQAMPLHGTVAAFHSGEGLGLWVGIVVALRLPFTLVRAVEWKRGMLGGLTGATKEQSRRRALELFPGMEKHLARVKDHGRAEALLIAEYMRRKAN